MLAELWSLLTALLFVGFSKSDSKGGFCGRTAELGFKLASLLGFRLVMVLLIIRVFVCILGSIVFGER